MFNDISDLRASISGKDIPEDIKSRLLALHEENVNLKESNRAAQEKLAKAKTVRYSMIIMVWWEILILFVVHQIAGQVIQRATRG